MEVSILMPCLNEEKTIGFCVDKANEAIEKLGIPGEVVIADNGSRDDSISIAKNKNARVIKVKEKGYGNALRGGIEACKGKYILMGDSDMSYDFSHLPNYYKELQKGHDLVMGNRFKGGIKDGAMPFLHKYLGNPILSLVGRVFFNSKIGDFHCGLRAFDREKIKTLKLKSTGMEFASEMIVMSELQGLSISEIATTLNPDQRGRAPHLNTWRDGWRHLRFMLMFCPRWLFLYPGMIFTFLGLVGLTLLSTAQINLFSVNLGIHTQAYASLFLQIGFMAILFNLFIKVRGEKIGLYHLTSLEKKLYNFLAGDYTPLTSLLICLCGFILSFIAFGQWQDTGFGEMDPKSLMKLVIPSVALLGFGFQMFFLSFLIRFQGEVVETIPDKRSTIH